METSFLSTLPSPPGR